MSKPSLRQIAREIGCSHTLLSLWLAGKRSLKPELEAQYWAVVTPALTENVRPRHESGSFVVLQTRCREFKSLRPHHIYETFIAYKKASKGLTESSEDWFYWTIGFYLKRLQKPVKSVTTSDLITFLGRYEDKPNRRRNFYNAFSTFFKWHSITYQCPNPMLDRFGNPAIQRPKIPERIQSTISVDEVMRLLEATPNLRDRAIVALLADSGGRLGEIVGILVGDVNIEARRIRIIGKGNKEGWLLMSEYTAGLLRELMAEQSVHAQIIPEHAHRGSLFGLRSAGLRMMLKRLGDRTGIKCNAHAFRRGFAVELKRQGVDLLDIMHLGRWNSVAMVRRYTRAYDFEDAARNYKPIVR